MSSSRISEACFGLKRSIPGISISFKCECHIIMPIQYTKHINPRGFELGTTLIGLLLIFRNTWLKNGHFSDTNGGKPDNRLLC